MTNESTHGFILTRNSYDYRGKLFVVLWLATDQGPVKLLIENEKAIFFVKNKDVERSQKVLSQVNLAFESKAINLKTFKQNSVTAFYFNQLDSYFGARRELDKQNISHFESSIRVEDRYLIERFTYGSCQILGRPYRSNDINCYSDVKLKPSSYKPKLKALSIDIECSEQGELFSIGFYQADKSNPVKKVIMIGDPKNASGVDVKNEALEKSDSLMSDAVKESDTGIKNDYNQSIAEFVLWVNNEEALLIEFEKTILELDPDLIIGWNVINFDFRLLVERARLYQLKLNIGRGAKPVRWRDSQTDAGQGFISIEGRVCIDGIAALKAEAYQFPSFSLQAMAEHFLGEAKAIENTDDRLAIIEHDFKYNKLKLAHYNLQDCILTWNIFEKAGLIDFLILRSHLTGLELDRAGGSVAAFNNLYLPKLHRSGYISPNLPSDGGLASPGGYVMDSKPGFYKNVIVLDFKSLYPSIIRTFKIDPLGLAEGLKEKDEASADLIPGFKGAWFSRDNHILPELITNLWHQRDIAKSENDKAKSQAVKILMNSFYGVLGSGGCPFYDTRLASSITMRGHWIMQQTAKWIEGKGLTVIYGDTDSTFVLLDEVLNPDEAKAIGDSLAEFINSSWALKLKKEFDIVCHLEIEFETLFSRFLMPTIRGSEQGSKKRYAGLISEGGEGKLVFKGLENVRTDWTVLAKEFQEKLFQLVFSDQSPTDFIKQVFADVLAGRCDSKLVYRKRLRKPIAEYTRNVPPHVKAARIADEYLARQGKKPRYTNKGWIQYLVTVNGPQPLEHVTAPIDYQHYIDKQIEPIADGILPFIGLTFGEITDNQMGLF